MPTEKEKDSGEREAAKGGSKGEHIFAELVKKKQTSRGDRNIAL